MRFRTTTRLSPGVSEGPFHRCNLGLKSGDAIDRVLQNRDGIRQALGLPRAPLWLSQVHGVAVCDADSSPGLHVGEPVADAAITRTPGSVLAVLTADCLPVLLADSDGAVVGAVHAGWRGLAAGVIEACLDAMAVPGERIHAWLGPAIGPRAYEVGDEVRAAFCDVHADAASAFVAVRPGHWLCDLYTLARQRLAARGVSRVGGGDRCTFSEPEHFYSYRRDGARSGRFASLIWIAD